MPAGVGLGLAMVIVMAHLLALGNDLSVFVRTAPPFAQRATLPASVRVLAPDQVYDGQFFYRLAVDPSASRDVGIRFDNPSYRQQRVLYPLLAYVLSAGQADRVPFALVAINVAGLGILGLLGARFARLLGAPTWWGCLLPMWVGFTYTLARDLSEIVAACFLVGTLVALKQGRPRLAAGMMALAVLSRETAVILALAMVAWSIVERFRSRRRCSGAEWLPGVAGVVAYVGLQAILWARWGKPPLLAGSANLAAPFSGPLYYWGMVGQLGRVELAFFVFLVALGLASRGVPGFIRLALVGYLALLLTLSTLVWSGDTAWLRAGTEATMLASVAIFYAGSRQVALALTSSAVMWPAVARWAVAT